MLCTDSTNSNDANTIAFAHVRHCVFVCSQPYSYSTVVAGAALPTVASIATDYAGTTRPRYTRIHTPTMRDTLGIVGYGLPTTVGEL